MDYRWGVAQTIVNDISMGSVPVLDPQDRVLFTEALRPEGYELSWAIGTTYTLDLVAAVAAPLAFALFDWQ